ncbi:hypothetical protein BDV33DRAFT_167807 [Aspergillus novoparasiticus]|uniref:Uncharacterized protein n=1 Tax=Aspergillus novoparasiticus TaxID=986946 RepID=A0A5N6EZQ6_9EURO|nr:hypothetical protein BDV33DRAFT_167807 [Aspergillus novoparasiticus]
MLLLTERRGGKRIKHHGPIHTTCYLLPWEGFRSISLLSTSRGRGEVMAARTCRFAVLGLVHVAYWKESTRRRIWNRTI